jgi:CheY-like chemotaxis protein
MENLLMADATNFLPSKCTIWSRRRRNHTARPRVLVVDDTRDISDAIAMVLVIEAFPTQSVYSGRDAIEVAKRWRPDIVILDIWMPGMSGLDVARVLRQQMETADAIIVGHSALSGTPDLEAARQAGFDAYCTKPTDPAMLAPLLRYLVE